MHITIAQRLRPYSHTPGTFCLLPGSSLRFQVFPTRIVVDDISGPNPFPLMDFDLKLKGPAKDFTIQQDLEKGMLKGWGHFDEGYVRYSIMPGKDPQTFVFQIERCPDSGIRSDTLNHTFQPKQALAFSAGEIVSEVLPQTIKQNNRLSLGSHKAQDWDQVQRRADLIEIFPFWYQLGKSLPKQSISKYEGTLQLLEKCSSAIENCRKLDVYQSFLNLFNAGFEGMLSPRLIDTQHQGFDISELSNTFEGSPLSLLTEGAQMISQLFVQQNDSEVKILPLLPPEFFCGRMTAMCCGVKGEADIEWSKKIIRRMIFRSDVNGPVLFTFQKGVRGFRLRCSTREKGERINVEKPIECQSGKTYYFDNFQK